MAWDLKSIPLFARPAAETSSAAFHVSHTTRRLQPKLLLGASSDSFEREAEAVANQIAGGGSSQRYVQSSAPPQTVRRKCAACEAGKPCSACKEEEEKKGLIQRSLESAAEPIATNAPASVEQVLRSPGQPLSRSTRAFFEPRLGADLSGVRVRTDAAAAASARDVNAAAYTVGQDLVFGSGRYAPDTPAGLHLLAHELTHVVQQSPDVRRETADVEKSLAVPIVQRAPEPKLMRAELWSNWFEICQRVKKTRVFKVTQNSLSVKALGGMVSSDPGQGGIRPECSKEKYNIQLSKVGRVWDSDKEGCDFLADQETTRNWVGLDPGDYYLTISTQNTNPNCCLHGRVTVSEEANLPGPSCSGGPGADVAGMPMAERLLKAIELSYQYMGDDTVAYIKGLLSPEAIAAMVGFAVAYVVAQTTPIGWVADLAVAGIIVATVLLVGKEAIDIVKLALDFIDAAKNAKNEQDLDGAGRLFSQLVTRTSLDIVAAILFHKVAKAANLKPPGPRSPGIVDVLKTGGGKVQALIADPATEAVAVGPKGVIDANVPLRDPNALMSEAQKLSGAKGSAGDGGPGKGSGKGTAGAGDTKPPSTFDQMGKQAAGADEQAAKRAKALADQQRLKDQPQQEPGKKETGAQQEKRLLDEDRATRPANDATYYSYEGKNSGSFNQWVGNLKTNIKKFFPDGSGAPTLNEAPLKENTQAFIERHANLKAEWNKMRLPLDEQLNKIQQQRRAAGSDRATVGRLDAIEKDLIKQRDAMAALEQGDMGSKRPDLVELFFKRQRAVVTDITQMTTDSLHNFKTRLYVELLKEVLGWTDVNGNNFNTVGNQNITP